MFQVPQTCHDRGLFHFGRVTRSPQEEKKKKKKEIDEGGGGKRRRGVERNRRRRRRRKRKKRRRKRNYQLSTRSPFELPVLVLSGKLKQNIFLLLKVVPNFNPINGYGFFGSPSVGYYVRHNKCRFIWVTSW